MADLLQDATRKLLSQLLQNSVEQLGQEEFALGSEPEMVPEIVEVLEKLAALLSWQDDPLWLEALAAQSDGLSLPEVAAALAELKELQAKAPAIAEQVVTFGEQAASISSMLAQDHRTFAEQWQSARTISTQPWQQTANLKWQQWLENGKLIVHLLRDKLATSEALLSPQFSGLVAGVKGNQTTRADENVLWQLVLTPEQTGDFEIEAVLLRKAYTEQELLRIRVVQPSRWPQLAGTKVKVRAGDWLDEALTDKQGMTEFSSFSEVSIDELTVEVIPPDSSVPHSI